MYKGKVPCHAMAHGYTFDRGFILVFGARKFAEIAASLTLLAMTFLFFEKECSTFVENP